MTKERAICVALFRYIEYCGQKAFLDQVRDMEYAVHTDDTGIYVQFIVKVGDTEQSSVTVYVDPENGDSFIREDMLS